MCRHKRMLFIALLLVGGGWVRADTASWTERYDVAWDHPSERVEDNMPLGAGDMACNVWVEQGNLFFYMQRSGSFNEIGEVIKLGRVRLTLSPNPFKDWETFSQKLVLKDGYIDFNVKGRKNLPEVGIKMWVDQFTHSVHLDIDADQPVGYSVAYENWRYKDELVVEDESIKKGGRWNGLMKNPSPLAGVFSFVEAPFDVQKYKDEFRHEGDQILFYHRNPEETLAPNFAIHQQGMDAYKGQITNAIKNRTMGGRIIGDNLRPAGTVWGRYYATVFRGLALKTKQPAAHHHLAVVTHVAQTDTIEQWEAALEKQSATAVKTAGSFDANKAWWNAFWDRSWIVIRPEQQEEDEWLWQMGRNYNLFRYQLGGNAYGEYPTKFNGGNLTFDNHFGFNPDWRIWGGDFHTAQNQRLVYWPMLKSGDFDHMHSQFKLYMDALPGSTLRVKEHFGHEGAQFAENCDPSGMCLPVSYGFKKSHHGNDRSREVPFGDPSAPTCAGANRPIEVGVQNNTGQAYHYTSQLEFSYMMLEYFRFCGEDITPYLPMIKQSLIFFDQHYQKRKMMRDGTPLDEHGKLVIFPSQGVESYRGTVTNPTDLISGLHACLSRLIGTEIPGISQADKAYYRSFLTRVPDLPFGELDGRPVMKPAEKFEGSVKMEIPQLYPLFPFDRFSMTDPEIDAFRNTWKYDTRIRKNTHVSWHQDGIFLARMGLLDECLEFNGKKLGNNVGKRRFPTFWGPGHDWTPDHNWGGSGMIGLQEMLMQTVGDEILILPTWPKGVDVDFKLHAPKKTTVDVSFRNGKIVKLEVIPAYRKADVNVMIGK